MSLSYSLLLLLLLLLARMMMIVMMIMETDLLNANVKVQILTRISTIDCGRPVVLVLVRGL